jgi:hypothetical protein
VGCCYPFVCQPIGKCDADDVETACACLVMACGAGYGSCLYDAGTFSVGCRNE